MLCEICGSFNCRDIKMTLISGDGKKISVLCMECFINRHWNHKVKKDKKCQIGLKKGKH